jgi:hypothetical protein
MPMNHLPTPAKQLKPTTSMDASDALYLDTLCDRRDAAMLSPFTDAEGLLAGGEEAGTDESADAPTATPVAPN